jgi:murein L,D-transpeptidase YafK
MRYVSLFLIATLLQQSSFKQDQLKNARVKNAYEEKESVVKEFFSQKNFAYPGFHLFVRAFKREQILEVWVKEKGKPTFDLLTTYKFCSSSGMLGPKRKEGDLQIPEGIYHFNHFNPLSNFHLSLGVSYPNASDKILSDKKRPGGAIYVHGNCVTIGCIPITDERIKELYVLAVEAKNNGQKNIPIHIFPSKLDDTAMANLKRSYQDAPSIISFWENLQPIYQDFETNKKLRAVGVDQKGKYTLTE